jgi:cold shock CspA family protein
MKTDPQIDFQGMEPSGAFRDQILTQIKRLEDHYGRLTACRVVVKAPSARHHTGGLYDVHIHLTLPDKRQVAVEHIPHLDERFQRFEYALHDAFNRAVRQLQDQIGEMRGKVKLHDEQPTGVVKKLLPEDGYGFLESVDGREIYFNRSSVREPGFDCLALGARVRFVEEQGEKGPQASRVTPLGEHGPK